MAPADNRETSPSELDTITVMMPTFRRPGSLARALEGLAAQRHPGLPWDLVVVDNEDPPGEAEAVFREQTERLGVPARIVREARRGAAHARNRGIAEATGSIVAMIDDDVVPDVDWLSRIVEPITQGRSDSTGGRVVLDPSVPRPRWFDQGRIGGYLAHFDPGPIERELEDREIILTSNAAFRADVLRATGGFDPAFGPRDDVPYMNDDAFLTRRVRETGGRLRYVPDAVVVHELPAERLRPLGFLRRVYYFGRSEWMFERETLERGRANGVRVALVGLVRQLAKLRREGLGRPEVAFFAACLIVRTAGSIREAIGWMLGRRARSL